MLPLRPLRFSIRGKPILRTFMFWKSWPAFNLDQISTKSLPYIIIRTWSEEMCWGKCLPYNIKQITFWGNMLSIVLDTQDPTKLQRNCNKVVTKLDPLRILCASPASHTHPERRRHFVPPPQRETAVFGGRPPLWFQLRSSFARSCVQQNPIPKKWCHSYTNNSSPSSQTAIGPT